MNHFRNNLTIIGINYNNLITHHLTELIVKIEIIKKKKRRKRGNLTAGDRVSTGMFSCWEKQGHASWNDGSDVANNFPMSYVWCGRPRGVAFLCYLLQTILHTSANGYPKRKKEVRNLNTPSPLHLLLSLSLSLTTKYSLLLTWQNLLPLISLNVTTPITIRKNQLFPGLKYIIYIIY